MSLSQRKRHTPRSNRPSLRASRAKAKKKKRFKARNTRTHQRRSPRGQKGLHRGSEVVVSNNEDYVRLHRPLCILLRAIAIERRFHHLDPRPPQNIRQNILLYGTSLLISWRRAPMAAGTTPTAINTKRKNSSQAPPKSNAAVHHRPGKLPHTRDRHHHPPFPPRRSQQIAKTQWWWPRRTSTHNSHSISGYQVHERIEFTGCRARQRASPSGARHGTRTALLPESRRRRGACRW